jgi:hypothetical protein
LKPLKTFGILGALLFGALSTSAFANDAYMRVKVPFAFVVAGQQFAPGEYVVKQNDAGVILVQGEGKGAMVISSPAAPATASHGSSLRFTNANLTTVSQEGEGTRSIPVHAVEQRSVTMSSR